LWDLLVSSIAVGQCLALWDLLVSSIDVGQCLALWDLLVSSIDCLEIYHIWNKFYMGKNLLHVDVIGDINLLHILYHVLYIVETHILRKKDCQVLFKVLKKLNWNHLYYIHFWTKQGLHYPISLTTGHDCNDMGEHIFHRKRKWKQRNRVVNFNNVYDKKNSPFFKTDWKPVHYLKWRGQSWSVYYSTCCCIQGCTWNLVSTCPQVHSD